MAKLAPKMRRVILINNKDIIDHRIHLTIPEKNGEIITHGFLELIIILATMIKISDLKQLILYNNLSKYLYTVPIDFQIIHSYYRDNIEYYPPTKTNSSLELLPVSIHPILE